MTVKRIWHGYTTHERADEYEALLKAEVIEGIEAKKIPGFRKIEVLSRPLEDEVEFITIMEFDNLSSVRSFTGEDYEQAYVPDEAKAVLSRFDERSQHYQVRESRSYLTDAGSEPVALAAAAPTDVISDSAPVVGRAPEIEQPVIVEATPAPVEQFEPAPPADLAASLDQTTPLPERTQPAFQLHPDVWFVRKNKRSKGSVPVTREGYRVGAKFVFGMFGWALVAIAMVVVGMVWGPQWLTLAGPAFFVVGTFLSAWYFISVARKHTDYSMTYDEFLTLRRSA